jgi:hypothetical protein
MKSIPYIIAIIAVIIAVVAVTCSGPDIDQAAEKEQAYIKAMRDWEAVARKATAQTESILNDAIKARARDSVAVKAANERISYWKKKAIHATTNIPQIARDTYPQIDSALAAKDSVIRQVEIKADTLQFALYRSGKEFTDLLTSTNHEKRIASEMLQSCEQRREEMKVENRKQVRKERRAKRLASVIAPIIGVAALLVGSHL